LINARGNRRFALSIRGRRRIFAASALVGALDDLVGFEVTIGTAGVLATSFSGQHKADGLDCPRRLAIMTKALTITIIHRTFV
jgi:hypothetical protein